MAGSVDADPRIGSEIAGYRVERLLGRGGMGVVYLAYHERLDRYVALKLLAPELAEDEEFRERFLRESRLAASLDHPNVIPIYDADEADGLLFIAMRYVEGTDFGALLKGDEPVSVERSLAILARVASALDAAHARGLVHRDVKPENVLLAESSPREPEHVYLTDFGSSTRLGDDPDGDDDAAGVLGSLDYLAPEQIEDGEVSAQTDVYALGCVLFRVLTGEAAFSGTGRLAVVWAHLEEEPPRPSERNVALPTELDAVTARAMAKRPEERHASCIELVGDVGSALGMSDEAFRVPRSRKSRRRLATVAALVAVLVAVAAVVPAVLLTRGDEPAVGERWSRVVHDVPTFGASVQTVAQDVIADDSGLLVAVGWDGQLGRHESVHPDFARPAIWTSADGAAWTRAADVSLSRIPLGMSSGVSLGSVAAGPTGLVAVGTSFGLDAMSFAWTSENGLEWERASGDADLRPGIVIKVIAAAPGFVVVGCCALRGEESYAPVWVSGDGSDWREVSSDSGVFGSRFGEAGFPIMWGVVADEGGRLVAVGNDADGQGGQVGAVWLSSDGVSWARAPHDNGAFGDASSVVEMRAVAVGGPGFVAVGAEADSAPEGLPLITETYENVRSGIPAMGIRGAVWSSEDGLTWNRLPREHLPSLAGVRLRDVTAGGPGLVAVGWRTLEQAVEPLVWTSEDGEVWQEVEDVEALAREFGGQALDDVAAGGPGLVAVGTDGDANGFNAAVWTSP